MERSLLRSRLSIRASSIAFSRMLIWVSSKVLALWCLHNPCWRTVLGLLATKALEAFCLRDLKLLQLSKKGLGRLQVRLSLLWLQEPTEWDSSDRKVISQSTTQWSIWVSTSHRLTSLKQTLVLALIQNLISKRPHHPRVNSTAKLLWAGSMRTGSLKIQPTPEQSTKSLLLTLWRLSSMKCKPSSQIKNSMLITQRSKEKKISSQQEKKWKRLSSDSLEFRSSDLPQNSIH